MELGRHFVRFATTVQRNGTANVVHDYLARIAAGQVLGEFVADLRIDLPIHIFVEGFEQFFAVHETTLGAAAGPPILSIRDDRRLTDAFRRPARV